jgi:N-hydroxyarylamine O-acetyltransferase
VRAYLERIGHHGPAPATLASLQRLHARHLLTVPFENLDIQLTQQPIVLDIQALFDKVVRRRRGGFCYELNGLFCALLRSLGFGVRRLSARVRNNGGDGFGPEFDHMVLLVELERAWLADVGFGAAFREPLQLEPDLTQAQFDGVYRVRRNHDGEWCYEHQVDGAWQTEYLFTLTPRRLGDFAAMCLCHQSSPASIFTRKLICTIATEHGRVTISNQRLIITDQDQRKELTITSSQLRAQLLRDHFGITLQP